MAALDGAIKGLQATRPPRRILIIAGPAIGDVFLSTPVLRSVHAAWPAAQIDYLVPRAGDAFCRLLPNIFRTVCLERKLRVLGWLKTVYATFRRYDLAIACTKSKTAVLSSFCAAPCRIGIVPRAKRFSSWRRWVLQGWVEADPGLHATLENLRLVDVLGIPKQYPPVLPEKLDRVMSDSLAGEIGDERFAVFHCFSRKRYKAWPEAYWREMLAGVTQKGIRVLLTGSGSAAEVASLEALAAEFPERVRVAAGKVDLAESVELVKKALFFLGVDTGMTHLAAATGTPTFVLIGPTSMAKWAPLPVNFTGSEVPVVAPGTWVRYGNVVLMQGRCTCRSLRDRCPASSSGYGRCLEGITPQQALAEIAPHIAESRAAGIRLG